MIIEDRLRNWSAYYRDGHRTCCCGSLEGGFRSNYRQWQEISDIHLTTYIDWRDAEEVEKAWRKLHGRPKILLRMVYMDKCSPELVCRKIGVRRWQYGVELMKAKINLTLVLDGVFYK